MGPYARAVAAPSLMPGANAVSLAAAPAGTPEAERGTALALQAAERVEMERVAKGRALIRARRSLLEKEYCSIPLQEKALLLEARRRFRLMSLSDGVRRKTKHRGMGASDSAWMLKLVLSLCVEPWSLY